VLQAQLNADVVALKKLDHMDLKDFFEALFHLWTKKRMRIFNVSLQLVIAPMGN
jgi:hypothetical protein